MPREEWTGYKRFCPLARGLDLVGDRWTLVIMQELLSSPKRYSELLRRLPGIGSTVLAQRLRKLQSCGVIEQVGQGVGRGTAYAPTEVGRELETPLRALREWGVRYLVSPCEQGVAEVPEARYDVSYVRNVEALPDEEYELRVGGEIDALVFRGGTLLQRTGHASQPAVVVETTPEFMQRWAAGDVGWEEGRQEGSVRVEGPQDAWWRMLAATGYLLEYLPERGRNVGT